MIDDFSDFGLRTSDAGPGPRPETTAAAPASHHDPDDRWGNVPAQASAPASHHDSVGHWRTVPAQRRILAVARTVPATRRVLDVLAAADGDTRVEVMFGYDPGSRFGGRVPDLLAEAGITPIPFEDAAKETWDLAVAASASSPLRAIRGPVFVVPHGIGHSRFLGDGDQVGGMSGGQLLDDDRVIPAAIGLPHPDDAVRLARQCPPASPYAEIIGDPCWDRLLASTHRRDLYRQAFGVGPERLIVLTSTWGAHSQFAQSPQLAARLLAELPWDAYRVAMVLHPAVRAGHGEHNTNRWLRPALDRGLILVSPDDEWRAALVAADLVLGDHGSVGLYAAALGIPFAHTCFGWEEIASDSPVAVLGRTAARFAFAVDQPLERQVAELIEVAGSSTTRSLADRTFAHQGASLSRISEIAYRFLDLPLPARQPTSVAIPEPTRDPGRQTVTSWDFRADVNRDDALDLTVTRWPATTEPRPGTRLLADVHDLNPRLPRGATVLIRTRLVVPDSAARDLAAHPAAYVAAALHPDRVVLSVRTGGTLVADTRNLPPDFERTLIPAAVHALLFQTHQPIPAEIRINSVRVPISAS